MNKLSFLILIISILNVIQSQDVLDPRPKEKFITTSPNGLWRLYINPDVCISPFIKYFEWESSVPIIANASLCYFNGNIRVRNPEISSKTLGVIVKNVKSLSIDDSGSVKALIGFGANYELSTSYKSSCITDKMRPSMCSDDFVSFRSICKLEDLECKINQKIIKTSTTKRVSGIKILNSKFKDSKHTISAGGNGTASFFGAKIDLNVGYQGEWRTEEKNEVETNVEVSDEVIKTDSQEVEVIAKDKSGTLGIGTIGRTCELAKIPVKCSYSEIGKEIKYILESEMRAELTEEVLFVQRDNTLKVAERTNEGTPLSTLSSSSSSILAPTIQTKKQKNPKQPKRSCIEIIIGNNKRSVSCPLI